MRPFLFEAMAEGELTECILSDTMIVIMTTVSRFDASEFLDDDDLVAEYLTAAMEDDNPDVFIAALGDVAKARGMTEIARASGLGRESLYKSLRGGSKARFETLHKIVNTLGLKMTIVADRPTP